jgi:hypothetical protein
VLEVQALQESLQGGTVIAGHCSCNDMSLQILQMTSLRPSCAPGPSLDVATVFSAEVDPIHPLFAL